MRFRVTYVKLVTFLGRLCFGGGKCSESTLMADVISGGFKTLRARARLVGTLASCAPTRLEKNARLKTGHLQNTSHFFHTKKQFNVSTLVIGRKTPKNACKPLNSMPSSSLRHAALANDIAKV